MRPKLRGIFRKMAALASLLAGLAADDEQRLADEAAGIAEEHANYLKTRCGEVPIRFISVCFAFYNSISPQIPRAHAARQRRRARAVDVWRVVADEFPLRHGGECGILGVNINE